MIGNLGRFWTPGGICKGGGRGSVICLGFAIKVLRLVGLVPGEIIQVEPLPAIREQNMRRESSPK